MHNLNKLFYKNIKEKTDEVKLNILFFILLSKLFYLADIINVLLVYTRKMLNNSVVIYYSAKSYYISIIFILVSFIISSGLHMEIFSYIKTGEFKNSNIFVYIRKNFTKFFVVSIIYLTFYVVLMRVGLIGNYIYLIFELSHIYFNYLLYLYPEESILSLLIKSWKLIIMHITRLLSINIHYYWGIHLLKLIRFSRFWYFSLFFMALYANYFIVVFLIYLMCMLILFIKYTPYLYIAYASFFISN